ncbi:hypothetical protein GCM10020227_43730 [Streptomyces flavovirens]
MTNFRGQKNGRIRIPERRPATGSADPPDTGPTDTPGADPTDALDTGPASPDRQPARRSGAAQLTGLAER